MFKHALTQDVAYESLLVQRRRELHRLIGLAIEELYADRIAEHYEVLAHHFSRAEVWDKALHYLLKAAKKTAAAFGIREALALYEEALAVTRRLGRQRSRRDADERPSGAIGSPLRGGRVSRRSRRGRRAAGARPERGRPAVGGYRARSRAAVPPSGWRTSTRRSPGRKRRSRSARPPAISSGWPVRSRFALRPRGPGNPEQAVPEIERALAISRSIGELRSAGRGGLSRHPAAHLAGALPGRAGRCP